jgi:hypothetical protein
MKVVSRVFALAAALSLLIGWQSSTSVSKQSSTTEFIDGEGNPTSEYLESSTAWVRVSDADANLDPGTVDTTTVDLSSAIAGDSETLILTETGPDTGVFEGSIELALSSPANVGDGILDTWEVQVPIQCDTITAVHNDATGSTSDTADLVPSYAFFRDGAWNDVSSYAVGEILYIEVHDKTANQRPNMVDEVLVEVHEAPDMELAYLTETGPDTGIFRGTQVTSGSAADGAEFSNILYVQAGSSVSLNYRHWFLWATSTDVASITATGVELIDADGAPTSVYLEGSTVYIRAYDVAQNTDQWSPQQVSVNLLTVSLDSETVTLIETGDDTGIFEGSIKMVSGGPISFDGWLQTSNSGPPIFEYDTITATYGVETDTAQTVGSFTSLVDSYGNDADSYPAGATVYIRVHDRNANTDELAKETTSVELQSLTTGDTLTVTLTESGLDTGMFEGSAATGLGTATADSVLQVETGETIRASHTDFWVPTKSEDTALIVSSSTDFIDAAGDSADEYIESSTAWVRVTNIFANLDPGLVDTITVDLSSAIAGDSETLTLTETGIDTGVFEGSIELELRSLAFIGNDVLDTWEEEFGLCDTITAVYNDGFGSTSDTAGMVGSYTYFRDGAWNDVSTYAVGETLYIEVRDEVKNDPYYWDTTDVTVLTNWAHNSETVILTETGIGTGVFRGSLATTDDSATIGLEDGFLYVENGMTITVMHSHPWIVNGSGSGDEATITQTGVELIDATGLPALIYMESSRVYIRVIDLTANSDPGSPQQVPVDLSSYWGGDNESVTLTETGIDTGIFEGSIELAGGSPSTDGVLQSGNSGAPAHEYDTLTAEYGAETCTARTIGSYTYLLDSYGNDATAYPVGGQVYLRVIEPNGNNNELAVETVTVDLHSLTTDDTLTVSLTETSYDTSVFEGSAATALGTATADSVLQVVGGETIRASHDDVWALTQSEDTATILNARTELINAAGDPVDEYLESSTVWVRVTDADANIPGLIDTTTVILTTSIALDSETLVLTETGTDTGVFEGSIDLELYSPARIENGTLDIWEDEWKYPNPCDTITAVHVDAAAGTSSDTADVMASYAYFRDSGWNDALTYAELETIYIEVLDATANFMAWEVETTVAVVRNFSSSNAETVTLTETGPDTGVFRASLATSDSTFNWADGDGIFYALAGHNIKLEHSHQWFLWGGSVDDATITATTVELIDAAGLPTSLYLEGSTAYLRVIDDVQNSDPGTLQQVVVTLSSLYTGDSENVTLTETGLDTSVFEGSIALAVAAAASDGVLQTGDSGFPEHEYDTITATYGSETDTAQTAGSFTDLIDDLGVDVSSYAPGDTVYVRVTDENVNNPAQVDTTTVTIESQTTGDSEALTLTETGLDTGVFEGSITSELGTAAADLVLQVTLGEVIRAYHTDANTPKVSEDTATIEHECSESYTLVNNTWKQIALPCNPANATVAEVFGNDYIGTYDVDWAILERDAVANSYRQLQPTDTVQQGVGYWIMVINGDRTVVSDGSNADDAQPFDVPVVGDASGVFNMVGHPFTFPVNWNKVSVDVGGGTFKTVESLTSTEATTIMSSAKWEYNGTGYELCDPRAVCGGEDDPALESFDGFWVKAYTNTTLRIDPNNPFKHAASKKTQESDEWYVRMMAEDVGMDLYDRSNILGRLDGAEDGLDSLDGEELSPFGSPYLTVVFPHPEWATSAWSYTSEYRQARPGAGGTWHFEVRSDVARTINLRWQVGGDTTALLSRTRLIDEESGVVVEPTADGSYTVSMAAATHSFSWVVNAIPQVAAGSSQQIELGETLQLQATFSDEDENDTHTATVDWGDGTVDDATIDQGNDTISAAHSYQTAGSHTVEICVEDNLTASDCGTITVSVNGAVEPIFSDDFEDGATSRWSTTRW